MPTPITKFLPFNTWTPDAGVYDNGGLIEAKNLIPHGDGGFISPLQWDLAQTLTVTPVGVGTHPDTSKVFYGSVDQLRDVAVGGAEEDRSGAVYTATSWNFQAFGGDIIAVGGTAQRPQYMDADAAAATNFADLLDATTLGNFDLKPKYVCTVGQRVMFGNMVNAVGGATLDNRVWISAVNNARRFGTQLTDPALLTTYQDLYDDYGFITGLSGGSDYAYIFKPRAIYRMDFAGPYGLTFKPISIGTGTVSPRSIVSVDGDVYFWGLQGPAVIRAGGTVVPLSNPALARLLDSGDASYPLSFWELFYNFSRSGTCGWFCPYTRTINWTFDATTYGGNFQVATVAYQVDSGRWGYTVVDSGAQPVLQGMATAHPLTQRWEYGRLQYAAIGGKLSRLLAAQGEYRLTTGRIVSRDLLGDKFTTSKIVRVRPRMRSTLGSDSYTVTIRSYADLYSDTLVQETVVTDNWDGSGYISVEADIAQAFDIRFEIAASSGRIYELSGIEVEFDVSSTKGP